MNWVALLDDSLAAYLVEPRVVLMVALLVEKMVDNLVVKKDLKMAEVMAVRWVERKVAE